MGMRNTPRMNRRVAPAAALVTALLGLPLASGATSFPSYPLQTGAQQVPPNILFILDDSGSMGSLNMPGDVYGELPETIERRSSTHNTVYYDPAVTYLPWLTAAGTRMSGGTTFGAAFSDYDMAGADTIDLGDPNSCKNHVQNGSVRTVCGGPTQATFFVLKSGQTADHTKSARYWRYQIRPVNGTIKVVRSEWLGKPNGNPKQSEIDEQLRRGCASPADSGNAWRNCEFSLPSSRSESAEIQNFATWFSYHRSRMKMAKAGALEAFGTLGKTVRVGYRTIWNRNNLDIPVADGNSGLFEDATGALSTTSRSTWYARVRDADSGSGTPLLGALQTAGDYYSQSDAAGPYGPEVGASQFQCRQNFSILTTDGYYNNTSFFNAAQIGEQDDRAGPSIYNPIDKTNAVRYTPVAPYRSGDANTLGDIAMKYWVNDLRTDLANNVPTSAANPAFWQHMVTFGVSIGLKGSLDQQSVAEVLRDGSPRKAGVNVAWPTPGSGKTTENIDDLLHAAVNGRGEFIAARNSKAFGDALNGILGQIQSRLASGSNVSTNSTSFQSDTRMYQATYMSGQWTGDLVARDVTSAGGISASEAWRVSQRIALSLSDSDSQNDFHKRTVLTWNGSRDAAFPTSAQETLLTRATGTVPVAGRDNADYIKGVQALERQKGGTLRNRSVLLGDIVNSSPFYVKDTNTLFVGANDGMLHAVNAGTGDVLFSYVPAGLDFARLATLSDPNYQHAFFVDGPIAVTPVAGIGTNYLVGTLGRGGKGAFAMDVTRNTQPKAIWDHTASADADMGYVTGMPLLARANDGRMVAIIGNGIDSTNGSAALYVYDLASGTQLRKFVVATGPANGLSAPRGADTNGDGRVDYVFAGDLKGNVWKFDLSGSAPSAWNVAYSGAPLFTTPANQPITGGLALAVEPGSKRVWITFGTGRLISASDVGTTSTQSLYGLIDGTSSIGTRSALTQRRIAAVGTVNGRSVRGFEHHSELPSGSRGWYIDLGIPKAGERVISGPRIRGRAAFYSSVIPDASNGCEPGGTGYLNVLDVFTGTSPSGDGPGDSSSYFDFDGDGSGDDETLPGSGGGSGDDDDDDGRVPIGSVDLGIGMPTESGQIDNLLLVCGSDGKCEDPMTTSTGGSPKRVGWREIIRGN